MNKIVKIFAVIFFIFMLGGCSNNTSVEDEILISEMETEEIDFIQNIEAQKIDRKLVHQTKIDERYREKHEKRLAYLNISFDYEYIEGLDCISYGLFTPSVVEYGGRFPVIIWLHGRGEIGCSAEEFAQRGGVGVLNEWEMKGFPAYIVCPHLSSGVWNNQDGRDKVMGLLEYFKQNYPIDENRVYIVGHSLGAQGSLYMVQKESIFRAVGLLSPYPPYCEIVNKDIPMKAFVGKVEYGEDKNSVDYTFGDFCYYYGRENIVSLNSSHGELPKMVFCLDEDENNKSDFFEWLLEQ